MMKVSEQLTETAIIERVLQGEKSLYELIIRRLNPYLYKVGMSYNYSHEDTQDLMQDTFVDAYKNLAQFQNRSSFKTWIIRIMLNNCYRKKGKADFKNELHYNLSENAMPMFTNPTTDAVNSIQAKELRHIIEAALANIPEDYRMAFSLREINGLSTAETSDVLGISEANVKVRLSRAKTMLRSKLKRCYSPDELFEFNLIYCDAIVNNVMKRIS